MDYQVSLPAVQERAVRSQREGSPLVDLRSSSVAEEEEGDSNLPTRRISLLNSFREGDSRVWHQEEEEEEEEREPGAEEGSRVEWAGWVECPECPEWAEWAE